MEPFKGFPISALNVSDNIPWASVKAPAGYYPKAAIAGPPKTCFGQSHRVLTEVKWY